MVADALQRLGGEQDVEILLAGRAVGLGQVPVKQGMAQPVNFQMCIRDRSFTGRAYIPEMLPQGVSAEAIR